ncbi:MAG: hypothetical protein ACRDRG_11675 [Pseudonocardiaceae bacterium]
MRRSSEPEERAQFTVAELLARYGEPAPGAGRRRRRATDDGTSGTAAVDTAAQSLFERGRNAGWEASAQLQVTDSPGRHDPSRRESSRSESSRSESSRSESSRSESSRSESRPLDLNGRGGRGWAPAVGQAPVSAGRASLVTPSVLPRRTPLTPTAPTPTARTPTARTPSAPSDGPVTDQLPRVDSASVGPASWPNRRPASAYGSSTSGAYGASTYGASTQPPAGLAVASTPEPNEFAATADEEPAPESGSPMWQWAVMVSQVGMGVVGGAALWLICEWLWQRIPVVALIVALAVIAGLVWIVRRVRRAEDLQTTLVAVLVGLFITVSPAALLLVGR